jgi:hypothetical protein
MSLVPNTEGMDQEEILRLFNQFLQANRNTLDITKLNIELKISKKDAVHEESIVAQKEEIVDCLVSIEPLEIEQTMYEWGVCRLSEDEQPKKNQDQKK